jgi:diguanylate cyclase (GGDEF)-like protein
MELDDESQPRILLADDSKMIRATARKMLADQFDLILAESGEQAWAVITSDPTVLAVLTDVTMPGLNGYDLLRRIRQDERGAINELPVIIVTGDQEEGVREQALGHGATDFITKPFERSELVARASAYATHDRMRRQAQVLKESQTQDTITGLGNGRYIGSRLKAAHAYSLRHGQEMAVVHIDLLGFDIAAREHGTPAAKRMLREAGQVMAHRVREEDSLGRIGKARFAAVCPGCDRAGAERLAHRLIEGIGEASFSGVGVALAAAAGVHVPAPAAERSIQTVYDSARDAVERAAAQGDGTIVTTQASVAAAQEPAASADERPAGEPEAADTDDAAPARPNLDEALAMLDEPGGAERLAPHLPELLERCEPLFRAADPAVAGPVIERLRAAVRGDG